MQAPRNPSPPQSSGARSSGYCCRDLHQRPVQRGLRAAFAPGASAASYPPRAAAGRGSGAPARSIFRAGRFGWWVVTHSLEDADFWGHLPAVGTGRRRSAGPGGAPWPGVRIVPPRPSCLPGGAHAPPAFARPAQASGGAARPFGVWGAGEGQAPRSRRPALYGPQLRGGGCPGRHFGGNQLPGGSMSLSPPCPAPTSDLRVSTAAGLHQAFARPRPRRA